MASKVGEAYVLVHTRTRPLSTAQKRAMERQAGEGARAWTSKFGKEVEARADKALAGLEGKLADVFARSDFDSVKKEFGDTAKASEHLQNSLRGLLQQKRLNKAEFKVLSNAVKSWEKTTLEADAKIRRITEQDSFGDWLRKQEDAHRKNFTLLTRRLDREVRHNEALVALRRKTVDASVKSWDEEFRALEKSVNDTDKMLQQAYRMNQQHDTRTTRLQEAAVERQRRMLATAYRMNEQFDARNETRQAAALEQEAATLARRMNIHRSHLDDFDVMYRRNLSTIYEVWDRNEAGATRFTRGLNRMNRQMSVMPNVVGVIFGRGSRNNFLNFLGSVMRNLAQIPALAFRAFGSIIDQVSNVGQAFLSLSKVMGPGAAATTLFRAALPGLVSILGTLVVAIGAASYAVPALASAISMVAGVFAAWAGVLVNAVLGALIPLVPLLVVVGGGFVALAVAMGRYWSKMQDIKADGGRLTREMRLLDEAVKGMSKAMDRFTTRVAPEAARSFSIIGNAVSGFLDAIGPGLERGLNRFNNIISGRSMDAPLEAWRGSMGGIIEDFTAGLGHLAAGLVKFFVPILPYVERLSEGFSNMMARFDAWAGSMGGQNTIAEWMDRAWTAAETLWSTLGNVWDILGSIFNIGTDAAGQGFLSYLEQITGEFAAWLETEEGRATLTQWFEDAAEFGSDLWEIIEDIGAAFDDLDTAKARDDLSSFLGTVESLVETADDIARFFEVLSTGIDGFFGKWEAQSTGDTGMDMGRRLGMTPEDADRVVREYSQSWDEAVMRWLLPDSMIDTILSWDQQINDALRVTFDVEGETFGEIGSNIGKKVWSGIEDWWGTNEGNQNWVKSYFDVPGETWIEISDNIIAQFATNFAAGFERGWTDTNETVKQFFRDAFNVDGETWAEIATNLWQGFADGLAAGFTYLVIEPFERFISDVKSLFGIASPSTVFFAMGVDIVLGLWNGLVSMWGGFWGYVSGIFATLISSVGTWLAQLPGIAATWFSQMWATASTWVVQLFNTVVTWISQLPGSIGTFLSQAWIQVSTWFSQMWTTATIWASQMVNDVITWIATLPGRFTTWLSQTWTTVSTRFRDMYNSAVQWARSLVDDAVAAIAGLPGRVGSALSGLVESIAAPFRNAYNTARTWINRITGLGGGGITVSAAGGGSSRFGDAEMARGGLVTSPTRALIGEAGPEVVVPLRRPLMQVDPSVRALSAILQGRMATASTGGGVQSTRPQIVFSEGSIVVQTVATDVVGIAESVVDRIAVRAGI